MLNLMNWGWSLILIKNEYDNQNSSMVRALYISRTWLFMIQQEMKLLHGQ